MLFKLKYAGVWLCVVILAALLWWSSDSSGSTSNGWSIDFKEAAYEDCDVHHGWIDFDVSFPAGYTWTVYVYAQPSGEAGANLVYNESGNTSAGDQTIYATWAAPGQVNVKGSEEEYAYLIRLHEGTSTTAKATKQGYHQYQEPPMQESIGSR